VTDAARLRAMAVRLRPAAGDAARIEARWLIEAAGGDAGLLERQILRRLAGEPLDRIIGRRGFWTLDLAVTPDVLSPRPDTETIVRAALDHVTGARDRICRILDLGTGSGAILLALLAELPHAHGVGVDISAAALSIATANARANGLADRTEWRLGSWADPVTGQFDIVVSNPPYIPSAEIAGLDVEVRDHDPALALDGGADGLDCYRAILPALPGLLAEGGVAVLEIGLGQADAVPALAATAGLAVIEIRPDLGGVPRAVVLHAA
jgi:release factor glutamine methyltransferase